MRTVAIYLPQFHPIPENDEWWGKGFTEWRNTAKAKPLFEGHHQPHLPTDLGYYDLRVPEAREAQALLAKSFGIHGFCYYHYWFNGRRILERPFQEVFESGQPDFPFMLCWANENWTRRWDGLDQEVLLEQKYNDHDDIQHIEYLIEYFKDPRYIRVNNKPVIVLYKAFLLPDSQRTVETWRRVALQHGMELYICHMVFSYGGHNKLQPGFDAAIDFEPFGIRREPDVFTQIAVDNFHRSKPGIKERIMRRVGINGRKEDPMANLNKIDYEYYYKNLKPLKSIDFKMFPTVMPSWDNTARRGKNPTLITHESSPEKFRQWLQRVVDDFEPHGKEEDFIFINAWN